MANTAFCLRRKRLDPAPLAPLTNHNPIDIHNPLHSGDSLHHTEINLLLYVSSYNLVGLRVPLLFLYLFIQTEKPFILLKYLLIRFHIASTCVVLLSKSASKDLRERCKAVKIDIGALLLVCGHPRGVVNRALLGVAQSLVRLVDGYVLFLGVFFFVDVRMVLFGQFKELLFYLFLRRGLV